MYFINIALDVNVKNSFFGSILNLGLFLNSATLNIDFNPIQGECVECEGGGGGDKNAPTQLVFSLVTSSDVGTSPFLTVTFRPFATLV